jgi:hypothetical protein
VRLYIDHDVDVALAERRDFRRLHRLWIEGGRMHHGIIISGHIPLPELERRLLRLFSTYTSYDLQDRLIPLHEFQ